MGKKRKKGKRENWGMGSELAGGGSENHDTWKSATKFQVPLLHTTETTRPRKLA